MKMRKAIVAGSFYPADKNLLEKQIKQFFDKNASLEKKRKQENKPKEKSRIVISPHAGYVFSGLVSSESIFCLEEADVFVILGTNHTGVESGFAVSTQDFETPFGVVKNDTEFSSMLVKNSKGKIFNLGDTSRDKIAHQQEHSIEVQLPFLQYLFGNNIKIVPVIIQLKKLENYTEFAGYLLNTAKKLKRKISIIASSDFTHFGTNYGFTPFSSNIKENLHKLDLDAIGEILKLNTSGFLDKASKTTICGSAPIALSMEIAKQMSYKKAKLINYKNSADISEDYSNVVGYASIIFV